MELALQVLPHFAFRGPLGFLDPAGDLADDTCEAVSFPGIGVPAFAAPVKRVPSRKNEILPSALATRIDLSAEAIS